MLLFRVKACMTISATFAAFMIVSVIISIVIMAAWQEIAGLTMLSGFWLGIGYMLLLRFLERKEER